MKNFLFLFVLFASSYLSSQTITMDIMKDIKPRSIGPGGMSGRVTAIDVVNANPDIMYVGTASGGLWKTTGGGIKWEPIFDDQVTASIGAVAIQQSNPSVIWVGTGEGNPRNSLNGGYGVYRSLDAGRTWQSMGLEKTRHIHRIIIDPNDPNTVYVGAIGSPWGAHPERGVFKTTDGGKTWEKILFTNNSSGVADMVMDPSNPNKLIVAMWEHKREPWFFTSGGTGSGLFITHDGGENWEQRTDADGLPKGDLGRIGLAIATNKPNIVYALVEAKKNALYRSDDGGFSWKKVNDKNDIGNRPFYYSDIFVDPQNENRIYSVFTYVNVSQDGGKSFQQLMPSYGSDNGVHPDHQAWWIHPENGNFMLDGNDGGLNITRDGGKTWRFIGNLPVAQFYHIAVDNDIPYNVYGGMQDNGSWRGPAYVWKSQGIRNSYWQEISFGDGFDVVPDPDDSRYGWSMSQEGSVLRYDSETGNNYTIKPTHPDPSVELRFNWNSAINIDPYDTKTLYFGSQFVHKSKDKGLTWEIISPDLTTNDPLKQKQDKSGGLTMDATGAENHTTILVIEPSPLERDMLWVGTDDGKVHYTRNGGRDWVDVSDNIKGLPKGSWIAQIKASNKKQGEALLVANDYRRFNYAPYAYRTTNYGETWERIVDASDVKGFVLSIVEDPEEKNLLFLGTDDGLYISINAGKDWTKWTKGFPSVSVRDLVIHPRDHDLVIGTFGRAAWILDDIRPLRAIASDPSLLDSSLKLFNPPMAYQASFHQPAGSRFGADALYNGKNRSSGAHLKYYFNRKTAPIEISEIDDSTEYKGSSKDSLYLKFYDGERLIRTLKRKIPDSSGLYSWRWSMEEAGVEGPSRTLSKRSSEPGGVKVKPGNYKVVLEYLDQLSDTHINIAMDPRLEISDKAIEERYSMAKKLEGLKETAATAVRQLVESKETVESYNKQLKALDENKFEDSIALGKEVIKKIDSLIALYLGKEDDRQGIKRSQLGHVMQYINSASSYVDSRPSGITPTENRLFRRAEEALKNSLEKTNTFFATEWLDYRGTIEKLDLSPFKETKVFTIEN